MTDTATIYTVIAPASGFDDGIAWQGPAADEDAAIDAYAASISAARTDLDGLDVVEIDAAHARHYERGDVLVRIPTGALAWMPRDYDAAAVTAEDARQDGAILVVDAADEADIVALYSSRCV